MTGGSLLVTGAAGHVGSAVVRAGLVAGVDVHALVHPRTDARRLDPARLGAAVPIHRADLHDVDSVASVLGADGPWTVVHAAARGGHASGAPERIAMWDDTVVATVALLEALRGAAVRSVVHVSSSLVYAPSDAPRREDDPLRPGTDRGAAKLAAEVAVRWWAEDTGIPAAIVRPFRVYGRDEQPGRLLPRISEALAGGPPVPLVRATTRRDWVHVDDVAAGLLQAGDVAHGIEALNLGTGVEHTTEEVLDAVAGVVGRPVPVQPAARPANAHDVAHWRADPTRAAQRIGWAPRDLATGMAEVFADVGVGST